MKTADPWNEYWQSNSLLRRAIEVVRNLYFARIFAWIVKAASPKGRILEAGCGSGKISSYLFSKGFVTVAADYSVQAARIAKQNCHFVVACDIFCLPFKDDAFEVIFNQGVMEHFSDVRFRDILREFKRTSPKVVIIVPSKTSIFRMFNPFGNMSGRFFSTQVLTGLMETEFPKVRANYLPQSLFISAVAYGER